MRYCYRVSMKKGYHPRALEPIQDLSGQDNMVRMYKCLFDLVFLNSLAPLGPWFLGLGICDERNCEDIYLSPDLVARKRFLYIWIAISHLLQIHCFANWLNHFDNKKLTSVQINDHQIFCEDYLC